MNEQLFAPAANAVAVLEPLCQWFDLIELCGQALFDPLIRLLLMSILSSAKSPLFDALYQRHDALA